MPDRDWDWEVDWGGGLGELEIVEDVAVAEREDAVVEEVGPEELTDERVGVRRGVLRGVDEEYEVVVVGGAGEDVPPQIQLPSVGSGICGLGKEVSTNTRGNWDCTY